MKIKFKESNANPSLFIRVKNEELTYLFTYVDDIVIIGTTEVVKDVIGKLAGEFLPRELGDLKFFLGIHVRRKVDEMNLLQQ